MNDKTCSTCKHWTQDGPWRGACSQSRVMPLGQHVVLVGVGEYPISVTLPLATRPDFGCPFHDPRPGAVNG